MKIVSLLCKLIQFLMVALSVAVHKALILLVFLNHPYQSEVVSLSFPALIGILGVYLAAGVLTVFFCSVLVITLYTKERE